MDNNSSQINNPEILETISSSGNNFMDRELVRHSKSLLQDKKLERDLRERMFDDNLKDRQADRDLKDKMFKNVVWICWGYLGFLALIIIVQFCKSQLGLDNSVIMTLLTTTMGIIIGLPSLIVQSLFPQNKLNKNSKN